MTKLAEWLTGITLYLGIWISLLSRTKQNDALSERWNNIILFLPFITLLVFGIYSLSIILWRVYNFNDCPEAAKELQEQIIEAKNDLKSKGLKF
uniref:Dolichol-phosphate mannosyltransferase subunit 3 n=1 Tax=Riptortus pedestris TaxID=329032 RepID=R4WTP2_RIPPE|nr:unkown protein [Riptortus pedestris]